MRTVEQDTLLHRLHEDLTTVQNLLKSGRVGVFRIFSRRLTTLERSLLVVMRNHIQEHITTMAAL